MSALAASRDRLEAARRAMDASSLCLMRGDVLAALKPCDVAYADLRDTYTVFAHDWRSLDMVLGQLTLIGGWCRVHDVPAPERHRTLLDAALNLRLAWLQGEECE